MTSCAPLLPSGSGSKSKLGRHFVKSVRSGRILFMACAGSVVLVAAMAVLTFGGVVLTDTGRGRMLAAAPPAVPSLADYPEVLVENSAPFKDIERPLVAVKEAVTATAAPTSAGKFVRDARVPAEHERKTPEGLDGASFPDMRIIILTMDRKESLARLYRSLAAADYANRRVDLDIWIDRRSASDSQELMNTMVELSRTFEWKFGVRTIHTRTRNAGLYEQWIYSWNPDAKSAEMALILEDDLEVSPQFFTWLRRAQIAYADDPHVAAFTLQRGELRPRQVRGMATGKLAVNASIPVYKYRLLGTWGFAPERRAWLDFRQWYEEMRESKTKPYVRDLVTTDWYKSQEKAAVAKGLTVANTMWSQWFIKWADTKNKFTVYANLPDGTTLAANYREAGMHYNNKPRSADFEVFNSSSDTFSFPKDAPYLDWDGRTISPPEKSV